MIKITLNRSTIKSTKKQKDTVLGLGLRKLHQSRLLPDTPEIRGMILKVNHLVETEEVKD
jgi:large subunit ribosomal protein L30